MTKKYYSPKRKEYTYYLLICILLILPHFILAQTNLNFHNETPDDSYVHVSRESMEKGPAYNLRKSEFFTSQVNVDSDGNDIIGDAANETSIAIDPTNPNRIVIGWRQFNTITSNFRQAGYGYSLDGGLTWTFPGVINPGVFRSDPVLDFDSEGNFYYNSLKGDFTCDVYKIDDGGIVWGAPVPANGGDKQWMRLDRTDGVGAGNIYSNWNQSFTTCDWDFTRSIDGGDSFEECTPVINTPQWGTLAVDADGTLYTVGRANAGLILVKSTTAKDPSLPVAWDFSTPVDLDGNLSGGGAVNPEGLLGQMWVDVDKSGGSGHGNVYVLASVNRSSNADNGDVMFAKSIDGGETFSAPKKINTDNGTDNVQWFGTMSVAPNGRIDVVWLDTRDAPEGTNDSRLYYSFSEDQGNTWSNNEPLSIAFNPNIGYPQQNKMGDYFDMISDNEGAHLAWANTINGGQDVYYTHISPENVILSVDDSIENISNAVSYPNPFSEETTIAFSIANEELVTVEVFDILGRSQGIILNEMIFGNYSLNWDGSNGNGLKLSSGIYFISIKTKSNRSLIRVILQ